MDTSRASQGSIVGAADDQGISIQREQEATYLQPQYQDYSEAESVLHHHDGQSTRTASVIGTDDNASLNSRTHFLSRRRQHSMSSSASTLRAHDEGGAQRRSTIPYLSGVHAARNPEGPKPKKTTSRKMFQAACTVVEAVTPLDVNREKTSMRESSVYRVFRGQRRESDSGSESHRNRAASVPQ